MDGNTVNPCTYSIIRPHFGTEFKIDLIDANNDTPIGTTLLTVQNLLHQQRDYFIHQNGVSLMQSLKGPLRFEGTQNLKLLLRGGVKSGFGNDFYVSPSADSSTKGGSFHPGMFDLFLLCSDHHCE